MATIVGKKFPNISVNAMDEMGDTFKINVLEEAVNNGKKVYFFGTPRISHLSAQQNYTHFKKPSVNLKKEIPLLLELLVILQRFISLG